MVASSYLVFWLAEIAMASSAVLATVVMGLVVNMRRSAISPEVLEFLHEFYEARCIAPRPPPTPPHTSPTSPPHLPHTSQHDHPNEGSSRPVSK